MLRVLSAVVLAGLLAVSASAQESIQSPDLFKFYVGANGLWYDAQIDHYPSDFEVCGNARASLSQHISAVGSIAYGFSESYVRGAFGGRFTAINPDNPDFSVGLGAQYHVSSEADVRPQEFRVDASLGWRPWPHEIPRVVLVALGDYGLDSGEASALVGVRYQVGGQP